MFCKFLFSCRYNPQHRVDYASIVLSAEQSLERKWRKYFGGKFQILIALYLYCHKTVYRKNSKIWDTPNNSHNCPKNGKVCCNIALMHPKDADGMANSVEPDQTASSEAV